MTGTVAGGAMGAVTSGWARAPVAVAVPADRLAAFRIVLGVFVTGYLLIRSLVFLELGDRSPVRFEPVGIFRFIGHPLSGDVNLAVLAATIATGIVFIVGYRYRFTGPAFAVGVLLLTSFRSSWGQLLHFENLMTLHLLIIAFAPAADAWSFDARLLQDRKERPSHAVNSRYGWPLQLCAITTVVTYVIAGIAKLRYGGLQWMTGETLRNHIAYSATRLELLGETPAPLAQLAVAHPWILRPLAPISVAVELLAPIALLGRSWRNAWIGTAWLMHLGILATMLVGFHSPLFLVAFAPMFHLEQIGERWRQRSMRSRRT